jgi:hypothetical protein
VKASLLIICSKKSFYFLFAVLFFLALHSYGQTNELGVGAWCFKQKGILIDSYDPGTSGTVNIASDYDESNSVPGFSFVHYHPLYNVSEKFWLGAEAGANFFGYYHEDETKNFYGQTIARESSGLYLTFQVPLYAACRFLNGSSENNDEGFGAGAGIGGMMQGFEVPEERGFMITPAFMVELKYNRFGARFDYLFNKFESHYDSSTGDIPRLSTSFFDVLITLTLGSR